MFALEQAFSKPTNPSCFCVCARQYSNIKMNFLKRFSKVSSDKMTLCNNNDQTWFSDTLTSARPSRVVKALAFQALVSTPPSGSSSCQCIENMFDPYIEFIKRVG